MTTEELLRPRWKVIADFPGSKYTMGQIIETNYWYDRSEEKGYEEHKMNKSWVVRTEWNISSAQFFDSYPVIFKKLEWWEERNVKDLPNYVRYKGCEMFRLNTPKIGEVLKVNNYQEDCVNHNIGCDWISLYEPATEEEYLQSLL